MQLAGEITDINAAQECLDKFKADISKLCSQDPELIFITGLRWGSIILQLRGPLESYHAFKGLVGQEIPAGALYPHEEDAMLPVLDVWLHSVTVSVGGEAEADCFDEMVRAALEEHLRRYQIGVRLGSEVGEDEVDLDDDHSSPNLTQVRALSSTPISLAFS